MNENESKKLDPDMSADYYKNKIHELEEKILAMAPSDNWAIGEQSFLNTVSVDTPSEIKSVSI